MRIYVNGTPVEVIGERGPAGPDGNPIGTVISFMGSAAPEDYLVCDGGVHNIAEYPDLAEFFQKQFGAANHFGGDGETNFAVPTVQGTETGMLSCIKARTSASAEDVYSLEERIVGRWIDGRPLYKKTIVGTSTAAGSVTAIEDVSELSIDWVVNSYGHIQSGLSVGLVPLPCTRDSGTLCIIGLSANRTKINMLTASSDFAKKPFSYTLEYVKTTDQPTIPLPEAETNALQEDWPGVAEDEMFREEV